MSTTAPRAVFVTRDTDYELLLARHATREQVRFFLETRGQDLADVEARHARFYDTLKQARAAVPPDWRSTAIRRGDLDRFLFAADDVVVAVGQDGLVANVAKYLDGQPVLGVNPDPSLYDGILVPLRADRLGKLLPAAAHGDTALEHRTMVEAQLDDGQRQLGRLAGRRHHGDHRQALGRHRQAGAAPDVAIRIRIDDVLQRRAELAERGDAALHRRRTEQLAPQLQAAVV